MTWWHWCIMFLMPWRWFKAYEIALRPGHLLSRMRFPVMPIMILCHLMLQQSDWRPLIFHHMHPQMKHCSTIHPFLVFLILLVHLCQQMHHPWTFLLLLLHLHTSDEIPHDALIILFHLRHIYICWCIFDSIHTHTHTHIYIYDMFITYSDEMYIWYVYR